MSTIAGPGLPTTGAMPSVERVYRTPKGVRIHGEIPPRPTAPDIPTENLTEADIQKLREYGRKAAEWYAIYGDEIKLRAREGIAETMASRRPVFEIKKGGEALVTVFNTGTVMISDAGKAAGLDAAFASALKTRGSGASRDEEIAWRIAYFTETLGLNNEDGGYEVFNALAKPNDAKVGMPNDLRAARNGYLLDLFS